MKSVKPGRGPSGMSFMGSIFAVIFGIFWTIMAFSITGGFSFGLLGMIFPLFGVIFVIMGIVQAIYHYKNATGENRYSEFDITDSSEEGDPSDRWIKKQYSHEVEKFNRSEVHVGVKYCPYCGTSLAEDFSFCPKCGKGVK